MQNFDTAIKSIIAQQSLIIGPVAIEEANKVPGLKVSSDGQAIAITADGKTVLENLVKQYASLFGRVSVEVCREAVLAVSSSLPRENLPDILK